MEKRIIEEINRFREIVGLPLIKEAAPPRGLIGQLLNISGFVDNVADNVSSAVTRLQSEAAANATGEVAAKLTRIQDELADVAESVGLLGTRSSSVDDLIRLLSRSTDEKVKTDLIKVLNRYFDEANEYTSNIIKNNKTLLGQIDKLDSKVLRDTLKETLGLQEKYLDDIIKTFYKSVTESDVTSLLKKLGMSFDDVSTQTIRKEIFEGIERAIANPLVKEYMKFVSGKDGVDKMKIIYNKSFEKISRMPDGITDANAEKYFNDEITKLIQDLKDAGLTKDMLTQFNEGAKNVVQWLTGYKNIVKAKGLGKAGHIALAIPRAYVFGWGTLSLLTALIVGGKTAISSKESLLKQYLQTEEGSTLYNEGNMDKFNSNFNQWKNSFYQALKAGVQKFIFPITQLGGVDTTPTTWTKQDLDKAFESITGSGSATTEDSTTNYINSLDDKDGKKGFKSWLKTEYYRKPNGFDAEDEKVMIQDPTNTSIYYYTPWDNVAEKDLPKLTFEYKDGNFEKK